VIIMISQQASTIRKIIIDAEPICVVMTKDHLGLEKFLEVDTYFAYSSNHLAKAVEATLYSFRKGESLRNLKYELYRRLMGIRELRKLPLDKIGKEDCNIYVLSCDELGSIGLSELTECDYGAEKILYLLRELSRYLEVDEERVENYLLSMVEATKFNKWLVS